ncbi:MAG: hypothetical protein ACYTBZ_02775 [Planctomycetota bacterium]|jgi:hypothetical protein
MTTTETIVQRILTCDIDKLKDPKFVAEYIVVGDVGTDHYTKALDVLRLRRILEEAQSGRSIVRLGKVANSITVINALLTFIIAATTIVNLWLYWQTVNTG